MKTRYPVEILCLVSVLSGFVPVVSSFAANTVADKAKDLVAKAQECMNRSADSRVMALNALRNAMSVQDEAERDLLKAMASPDAAAIKSRKKNFEKASEDSADVIRLVEKVIDNSTAAQMAANAALAEADKAARNPSASDAGAALDKADDLLASALKSLKKAETTANELKQIWLMPLVTTTTTTTSTTTTTLPPDPTPVGRR
jgi:hypothetical protein